MAACDVADVSFYHKKNPCGVSQQQQGINNINKNAMELGIFLIRHNALWRNGG